MRVKDRLVQLIEEHGMNLAQVSDLVGKNHSYLQQYVRYDKPRHLPEMVRYRLAELFQVDEREFIEPDYLDKIGRKDKKSAVKSRGSTFHHAPAGDSLSTEGKASLMTIFQTLETAYKASGKKIPSAQILREALDELERQKRG